MRIERGFDYDVGWCELAEEYCRHDSAYQACVFNIIGEQFKAWSRDKTRTATYIQLLEIAQQLNEDGKWFINTLHDYMKGEET